MNAMTERREEDEIAPAVGGRSVAFSADRVWLIASLTLREALRQRLFVALVLVALGFVVGAQWLRALNFGSSELKFIADLGFGTMALFGGTLTIVAAVQLFFREIEHRTGLTLLAKPLWRTELVLGKFVAVAVIAAVFCVLMTAATAAVVWSREAALQQEWSDGVVPIPVAPVSAFLGAALMQWLKLVVLAALALLVTSFAQSQLFALSVGFLVWAICELQYIAQEAAAHGGSAVSRTMAAIIAALFPNFQAFDLTSDITAGPDGGRLLRVALYSAGYVAIACALAAFSFRRREI